MGTDAREGRARPVARVPVEAPLRGRFVRRYKRFFTDVELDDGSVVTVHCANPGSMKGFHRPGAAVRCSTSDDPKRKLRHRLEMMRVGRVWVGLNTGFANTVARRSLEAGLPRALSGYASIESEVAVSHERSRLDFRLTSPRRRDAWVEVKSVTLAQGRLALFPDSVSERGRKHLGVLRHLHEQGDRAALLFLVQRADCDAVAPADEIDPAYGQALRDAAKAGVEIFAVSARVTARAITVERELPVQL